jgi:hypothetical protein
MSYAYQNINSPYLAQEPAKARPNKPTAAIIFIILFILILAGVVVFLLYWFLWRPLPSFVTTCSADTDCLPNQVCTNGFCNSLQCKNSGDCTISNNGSKTIPGSVCVITGDADDPNRQYIGFCQLPDCSSNAECGDDEACVVYNVGSLNSRSACVKLPSTCTSDSNCYAGSRGIDGNFLTCKSVDNKNQCVECLTNSDCKSSTGYCSNGICQSCDSDGDCGAGNVCGSDGVCCGTKNSYGRCTPGKMYDYCKKDNEAIDCAEGLECVSYYSINGGVNESSMICAPSSDRECLFSLNTVLSTTGGALLEVCTSEDKAFCVNGTCSNVASTRTGGSACGVPAICNTDKEGSLLCSNQILFNNPFHPLCLGVNDDCSLFKNTSCVTDAQLGKICAKKCNTKDSCGVGLICSSDGNKNEVCTDFKNSKGKTCYCLNPVGTIECIDDSVCPTSYACSISRENKGQCAYVTPDAGEDSTLPAFSLIQNYCSTPANMLNIDNQDSGNGGSSYCVNGYCNNNPGWLGDTCQLTTDCLFTRGDPAVPLGQLSFVCSSGTAPSGAIIDYCILE